MVNTYVWGAHDTTVDSRRAFMVHLNSILGASVNAHAWGIADAPIVCSKCICGASVRHSWGIHSTCEWIRGASVVHSNSIRYASNVHPWCFYCTCTVHPWCICGASFVHWGRILCALMLHCKHLKNPCKKLIYQKSHPIENTAGDTFYYRNSWHNPFHNL